ncbi:MAG: hypothetical protein WAK86_13525 [Pseudonocardiaceae bacterium]
MIVNGDARWCLRLLGDADTHRDELCNDGTEAGVVFQPPAVASPNTVPMTPTGSGRAALQVPDPVFPTKLPAGRRSSCSDPFPGGQPDPSPQAGESTVGQRRWVRPVSSPVPGSPVIRADAAARVLCEYFLVNAECGDNAANDEFIGELALRMRTGQARRVTETTPVAHRGVR